ncbi:hypothetical protein [Serinicoccus kebangsaanensis]|uniref:hypothetical protein n=1 Tax=Serinicoccus kebangsaanensis TaxID=2602069 RepID=UPI00192DD007|nr:hypothetical protein [Serinicoccus kebangsaanensis]
MSLPTNRPQRHPGSLSDDGWSTAESDVVGRPEQAADDLGSPLAGMTTDTGEADAIFTDGRNVEQGGLGVRAGTSSRRTDPLTDGSTKRLLQGLLGRPASQQLATPAALRKAWTAVEEAVEASLAAIEAVRGVDREESTARSSYEGAVRSSAASGEPMPEAPAPVNWEARRAERRAYARGLVDRAQRARRDYDRAAEALSGEDRTKALYAALAEAHEAALAAIAEARAQAATAATALDAYVASAPGDRMPRQRLDRAKITAALAEAATQVSKLDLARPIMADTSQTRCDMQTRRALHQTGDLASRYSLWRLERSEAFKVTDLTRDWPPLERISGAVNYEADARDLYY